MKGRASLPFGSFPADVVRIAVGLVLLPAVAILGLSLAMVRMLPLPGAWVFPLFLFPLGAGLLAGGVLLLVASREHHRIARNQALFVAQAGHELRTPLATLQLVAAELSSQPQQAELGHRLAAAAEHLSRGIERLLDWGRLTSGRLSLRLEPQPLGELLREAERLAWPRLQSRGQRLVREGEGHWWVVGHRASLVSAVSNLLVNASKYAPAGSVVELGVGERGGYVQVWVRDQGPGIPRAEQRKIFRPFYRGAGVEAEGVEGFGLGLAVVAQAVRAHGGEVRLQSQPGRGSCFTLRLPKAGGP